MGVHRAGPGRTITFRDVVVVVVVVAALIGLIWIAAAIT